MRFIVGRRWQAGVDAHGVVHVVSVALGVSVPCSAEWWLHGLCTVDPLGGIRHLSGLLYLSSLDRLEDRAPTCILCIAGMTPRA